MRDVHAAYVLVFEFAYSIAVSLQHLVQLTEPGLIVWTWSKFANFTQGKFANLP